jgi:hypothetical protein
VRDHPRPRVGDDGYQGGGGEADRHQATPVEERLVLAQAEAEKDQDGQGTDAEGVRKHRRGPPPPAPEPARADCPAQGPLVSGAQLLGRRPQEGECRATQQPRRPRVGTVVDPRRVYTWREQYGHGNRRRRRPEERDHQHTPRPQVRSPEAQTYGEHDRPHQVELLLHGQRPKVLQQRRSPYGLEVGLVAEDQEPVGDVAKGRQHVVPEPRNLAWQEDHREGEGDDEQHVECGE